MDKACIPRNNIINYYENVYQTAFEHSEDFSYVNKVSLLVKAPQNVNLPNNLENINNNHDIFNNTLENHKKITSYYDISLQYSHNTNIFYAPIIVSIDDNMCIREAKIIKFCNRLRNISTCACYRISGNSVISIIFMYAKSHDIMVACHQISICAQRKNTAQSHIFHVTHDTNIICENLITNYGYVTTKSLYKRVNIFPKTSSPHYALWLTYKCCNI